MRTTCREDRNNPMLENNVNLADMAAAFAKAAILIDGETTGLDQRKDEVIELGMVKFDYLPDGRVAGLRDVFSSFNEPSNPIPPEVMALTGITNDMVAGHRIEEAAVSAFADDAVI